MNPMLHIRKHVFGMIQDEMAEIAGVSQATVSKWENGAASPNRDELARIREEAGRRELAWDDRWFFEAPPPELMEAGE